MKIALVSPYDFAYPGGVATHISNLDRYLCRMGHEVKVIAPASKEITVFGDRFIQIGRPRPVPTSGSVARITLSLTLAGRIKAVLEEEKFDIVHLHEPFAPMLCSAVLRFSNGVNIGTFHACDARPGYRLAWPIGSIILKRRCRKLHGRIAVSQPAMRFAGKFVRGDFDIIPNGVDLENFSPDVSPIGEFRDGKFNILFVGRLEKRKGVGYLLRAYREVKREIPNSRLIIVGPGTRLRKKYERWVKRYAVADVVFIGFVPYQELPRYYQTADIFCAPATNWESFGIILLEAMAMRKPIVATNIEGYASVVTHGEEGWLVPPKDSRQLAQALVSVMQDEKLREEMGEKGRLKAQEYGWERVAERVVDYYHKVLKMEDFLNKQNVVSEKRFPQARFSSVRKTAAGYLTRPIIRLLAKTRISPNDLTWLGFGLTIAAVALILSGHLFAAGIVVLAAGFFDMLDGALARGTNQVTRFGSILDSTLDRVSEAALLLGILAFYALNTSPRSTVIILLAGIAMIVSFLVSYVRARAEGAGLECEVGLLTRTERVVVLVLGLLLNRIDYALISALGIIAILSSITVSQRLVYVWRQTEKNMK